MAPSERALVVCIKVGDKYGPEYVNKLRLMLDRHTMHSHDFVCLTDNERGLVVPWEPINCQYPGWWAKMVLFKRHRMLHKRRVVYLDLDTVIVDNVDFLFEYQGPFCMVRDWWASSNNSSIMSFASGLYTTDVWDEFQLNSGMIMDTYPGDQDYITKKVPNADLWPVRLVGSYKANELQAGPGAYPIVCFHGDPKPHTFKRGWVHEHWR